MTNRLARQMPLWTGVTLLLLITHLGALTKWWEQNSSSLRFWHTIDVVRSLADGIDVLYPKPGVSIDNLISAMDNPCQVLWGSRLSASFSSEKAQQLFLGAQPCSRTQLVNRWQGQVAWRVGETETAKAYWGALAPPSLVTWGRNLVLSGNTAVGATILQTAEASRPQQSLDPELQTLLYQTLGDLKRQAGDQQGAISDYQKAWEASGYSYKTAYKLGVSYASLGNCQQAVGVLETGLQNKPELDFPIFDSSYLIQLASCYAQLGNRAEALHYLDAAQVVIDSQAEVIGLDSTNRQQAWLKRVRMGLTLEPVP